MDESKRIIAATTLGVTFVLILLGVAIFLPSPTDFQYLVVKIALALAAAGFAAILPGTISANLPTGISAVGPIAIFAIVFFFSPASLAVKEPGSDSAKIKAFLQSLKFEPPLTNENQAREEISKLKEAVGSGTASGSRVPSGNSVIEFLQKLDAENTYGKQVREMANRREGPWRPVGDPKDVKVSVPGTVPDTQTYACPNFYGKEVELLSLFELGGEIVHGETNVVVKVTGKMTSAGNCKEVFSHEFQLSCRNAVRVFSTQVLECSDTGAPLWKVPSDSHILPASAIVIFES